MSERPPWTTGWAARILGMAVVIAALVAIGVSLTSSPRPRAVMSEGGGVTLTKFQGWASISCLKSGDCVTVGDSDANGGPGNAITGTLADGSWTRAPVQSRLPRGASDGSFKYVSCATTCVASGGAMARNGQFAPMVQTFVHGTWSAPDLLSVPASGRHGAGPVGSGCTANGVCWTTYQLIGRNVARVVAYEVSGRSIGRAVVLGPAPSLDFVFAEAISCWGQSSCALTGYVTRAGRSAAFVQFESDGRWARARQLSAFVPTDGPSALEPKSIDCVDSRHCVVGGISGITSSASDGFVLQLSGHRWGTVVRIPQADYGVGSVSCLSASSCLAVGVGVTDGHTMSFGISDSAGTWTAPHWFALSLWYHQPTVTCVGSFDECVITVLFDGTHDSTSTEIDMFGGDRWTSVETLAPGRDANAAIFVNHVACATATCWLAGDESSGTTTMAARVVELTLIASRPAPV